VVRGNSDVLSGNQISTKRTSIQGISLLSTVCGIQTEGNHSGPHRTELSRDWLTVKLANQDTTLLRDI
jgi:hypothetical protein